MLSLSFQDRRKPYETECFSWCTLGIVGAIRTRVLPFNETIGPQNHKCGPQRTNWSIWQRRRLGRGAAR